PRSNSSRSQPDPMQYAAAAIRCLTYLRLRSFYQTHSGQLSVACATPLHYAAACGRSTTDLALGRCHTAVTLRGPSGVTIQISSPRKGRTPRRTPFHGAKPEPYCWSMIFSENRYPLFGIMLYATHVTLLGIFSDPGEAARQASDRSSRLLTSTCRRALE